MKASRFVLSVIVALTFVSFAHAQPAVPGAAAANDVIKDPGFEASSAGAIKEWSGGLWAINGSYPGKAEVISDKSRARNGEKFLAMEFKKEPGVQNDFMIVFDVFRYPSFKDKTYTMKIWVRGEGEISIGFQRYDKNDKWISPAANQFTEFLPVNSPKEWKQISWNFIPKEEGGCVMPNISVKGKFDLDDVSLEIKE